MLAKFEQLYKKLNSAQKEAVDAVEGPVMVVAGPGTGKTEILTLRVANILRLTDTEPQNILALTFTEAASASMRRRLADVIGTQAYSVVISTFHGFCNSIIQEYPEEFPQIIGSEPIAEIDQIKILEDIITNLQLRELKPFGDTFYFLHPVKNCINKLKQEGVIPEEFKKQILKAEKEFNQIPDLIYEKGAHKGKMKGEYSKLQKQIKKNLELSKIYEAYRTKLRELKKYDYADMILEVLLTLEKNEDLLLQLQEKHQYILVDEHQDTNSAQNKIIELLCNFHENPNIFVVGDDKQAIFRFQGASIENFNFFKKIYPEAKLIVLEENYRSTQSILDTAHSLMAGEKELKSQMKNSGELISLFAFSKPDMEMYFLVKDIGKKISGGVKPEEIAVLYRENQDAFAVAKVLEKNKIPFVIESNRNILEDLQIKKLIFLMRAVEEYGSAERLIEIMHADFLGVAPLDIYKIAEFSHSMRISPFDVLKAPANYPKLNFESPEKLKTLGENLKSWKRASQNQTLLEFFESLVRESGFLDSILKSGTSDDLDKLNRLYDEIKSLTAIKGDYSLKEFLEYVDLLEVHRILIKKHEQPQPSKVRLMTAHGSKGLEFNFVYIINAYDGHWGNRRNRDTLTILPEVFDSSGQIKPAQDVNDNDERRLFYVAITRARLGVVISYSKESIDGQEQLPSRFIEEIKKELLKMGDSAKYESNYNRDILKKFSVVSKKENDFKNKEFVKDLFERNGLSVTALNNYLDCPWKYFYMNLLRLPKAPSKHQLYGIAVHEALKDFFDEFGNGGSGAKFLTNRFVYYLEKQPFRKKDFEESLEKGKKSLAGYYDFYHAAWPKKALNELGIQGIMLGDIRLTGKIDKIEFLDNDFGSGARVNVVDYKTSKPKSRGVLEGNARNANGNEKRQLVFYNLLLNGFEKGKYKMVSGDIDFIEPDDKGRYHKERFEVSKNEILDLTELIKQTADEILNLKFWNRECGDRDCEFCQLRKIMS